MVNNVQMGCPAQAATIPPMNGIVAPSVLLPVIELFLIPFNQRSKVVPTLACIRQNIVPSIVSV